MNERKGKGIEEKEKGKGKNEKKGKKGKERKRREKGLTAQGAAILKPEEGSG